MINTIKKLFSSLGAKKDVIPKSDKYTISAAPASEIIAPETSATAFELGDFDFYKLGLRDPVKDADIYARARQIVTSKERLDYCIKGFETAAVSIDNAFSRGALPIWIACLEDVEAITGRPGASWGYLGTEQAAPEGIAVFGSAVGQYDAKMLIMAILDKFLRTNIGGIQDARLRKDFKTLTSGLKRV